MPRNNTLVRFIQDAAINGTEDLAAYKRVFAKYARRDQGEIFASLRYKVYRYVNAMTYRRNNICVVQAALREGIITISISLARSCATTVKLYRCVHTTELVLLVPVD
jgi:hypothetical protein